MDEVTEPVAAEPGTLPPLDLELPDDPAAAVPMLLDVVAAVQTDAAARLDDLQRVAAEFENFRKRSLREQQEMTERASQRVVEALLPVLDSFDGAFGHTAQSPSEELLLSGVQGTFHQMMEVLSREGLEPIDAEGFDFDPNIHEAVAGGGGDDLVVGSVMRRGYTLRGRVIRPALVAVAPRDDEGPVKE
jgi:molecular chaperone GrpE